MSRTRHPGFGTPVEDPLPGAFVKLPDRRAGIPIMAELLQPLSGKIPPDAESDDGYDCDNPDSNSRPRDRRMMRGNKAASGLQQLHLSPLPHR